MSATAMNSTKRNETGFSNLLLPIVENLKKEDIFLNDVTQFEKEVKTRTPTMEERAVIAVNQALKQIFTLEEIGEDLSQAARILAKIQVAVAEVERASFSSHAPRAQKSFRIACHIADMAREIFHEMKERETRKKAA